MEAGEILSEQFPDPAAFETFLSLFIELNSLF
jgi:hypothetical protein